VPPDEYTEYRENVLQSYRHKQLNIQLQEYTEVPGEVNWWHRMQEKLSAAGAPPRTPLGELTALPRPPSWWGGRLAAPFPTTPLLSALWTSLHLFPHSKNVPHLIQAGDAPESDISYD